MSLPPRQAAAELEAIRQAAAQSETAYGYSQSSPHLMLWGAIWMAGYSALYLGAAWALVWGILVPAGVAGSFVLGRRQPKQASSGYGWRYGATALTLGLLIESLFLVLPPRTYAQAEALFPILVGVAYALLGIWGWGRRLAILGVAIGGLTLIGYYGLPQYFPLWLAGVGGGGLMLGGLWLRRV